MCDPHKTEINSHVSVEGNCDTENLMSHENEVLMYIISLYKMGYSNSAHQQVWSRVVAKSKISVRKYYDDPTVNVACKLETVTSHVQIFQLHVFWDATKWTWEYKYHQSHIELYEKENWTPSNYDCTHYTL